MLRRACIIAAIVGPVLIAINQGTEIAGGEGVSYLKAALTMVVPFLVSLVSSVLSARERVAGLESGSQATLDDVRQILREILQNARRVNQASTERKQVLEDVVNSARQLQASLDDRAVGEQSRSLEEILECLDLMRRQVDMALEGSATNIKLAEGGVGTLKAGNGNGA
jgi:methyl-accepting chemotaxis protein